MSSTSRVRALARLCWFLFAVSTAFPIVAALLREEQKPRWLGALDVAVAAALALGAMVLATRNRDVVSDDDRLSAFRNTNVVLGAIPVLLAIFFLVGNRVDWQVLVIGLAWRAWLFILTLPYLAAARTRPIDR